MQLHQAALAIAPFHLQATMAQQALGRFDPTGRGNDHAFVKTHLDDDGNVLTWRFDATGDGVRIRVQGMRPEVALQQFLRDFPPADGCEQFRPSQPLLKKLNAAYGGMRLPRVPWAFDVAAGAVLQQRVRWQVAYTDFKRIAERWGTRAEAGIAFPSARQLAALPPAAIEAVGIDPKRARALHALATLEARRPFLATERDYDRLRLRLTSLRGVGPWTANMIAGFAAGDSDAVPVGDLHLPSLVTGALANEPDGTDERMLELLEPYRGQRFRVIRLLSWGARRVLAVR